MTVLQRLQGDLRDVGLVVHRASPRGADRLILELGAEDGTIAAAQWFASAEEADRVCTLVNARYEGRARLLPGNRRLVVQDDGADRKLTGLHRVVNRPGARLVAHRAERRAVVRVSDGSYLKVVRPGATEAIVAPQRTVRPADVRTATVTHVDDDRGLVGLAAVAGQTLHARISDPVRLRRRARPRPQARGCRDAFVALDVRPHRPADARSAQGGRCGASLAPGGNDPRTHPRCRLAAAVRVCCLRSSPPLPASPRWCTATCTTSSW